MVWRAFERYIAWDVRYLEVKEDAAWGGMQIFRLLQILYKETIFGYGERDERKKKKKRRNVNKDRVNENGKRRGERQRRMKAEKKERKKRRDESKNRIMKMVSDDEEGKEEGRMRKKL